MSIRRAVLVLVRDIVLNTFIASKLFPRGLRWRAMRGLGMNVSRSSINASCFFGGTNVTVGEDAFINYQTFVDNAAEVVIGARCSFGPRVMILTGTHEVGVGTRRAGAMTALPVVIGEGAWLGANVTILPGVVVGSGALIAAGSVVTSDCEPDTLYVGVPARAMKRLEPLQRDQQSGAVAVARAPECGVGLSDTKDISHDGQVGGLL